jgi:hypothetical protein
VEYNVWYLLSRSMGFGICIDYEWKQTVYEVWSLSRRSEDLTLCMTDKFTTINVDV